MHLNFQKNLRLSILVFILVACQAGPAAMTEGGSSTDTTQAASSPDATRLVATPILSGTVTSTARPANCTIVSRQPTPGPTEQSVFPPLGSQDWVEGPPSAAVTFIEYSDFQ